MNDINYTQTLYRLLAALALAAAVPAQAAPVGPLITFSAGQAAKAADVNANFNTITSTVNANDTRLTNVEATKQNAVTGNCPAGSAIRAIGSNGTVTCQSSGGTVGFASVHSMVGVHTVAGAQTGVCIIFCSAIGRFQSSAGSGFLAAPIALPQGATITGFSFSCFCNDAAGMSAFLFRDEAIIASASITTVSTTVQSMSTTAISTTPTGVATVNNNSFAYFVLWSVNGTAASNLTPTHATVTYTLP